MTVPVTLTWMRSSLLPKMPLKVGRMIQCLAEQKCLEIERIHRNILPCSSPLVGEVVGFTTPAVKDIGAASLRIKFHAAPKTNDFRQVQENICKTTHSSLFQMDNYKSFEANLRKSYNIEDEDDIHRNLLNDGGGFLLAIRAKRHNISDTDRCSNYPNRHSGFLPAIAGIPGKKGLDRYGNSRVASAELIVMGRPLANQNNNKDLHDAEITFFSEDTISQVFPVGSLVEIINISRVTDFFLGLNAGRWLTIRIKEICDKGVKDLIIKSKDPKIQKIVFNEYKEPCIEDINEYFLVNTSSNLKVLDFDTIEDPPEDASYLFHHWGSGGNSGVSGQKIVLEEKEWKRLEKEIL